MFARLGGIMAHKLSPVVGHWYENTTAGERFEVLAVDADDDIIVIRFDSSDMEELDSPGVAPARPHRGRSRRASPAADRRPEGEPEKETLARTSRARSPSGPLAPVLRGEG